MSVAIDQARENCGAAPIDPINQSRPHAPEIVVIADFGNFSLLDENGAVGPATQSAEFRRINQVAAQAERAVVSLHKARRYETTLAGRVATSQFGAVFCAPRGLTVLKPGRKPV